MEREKEHFCYYFTVLKKTAVKTHRFI